MARDPFAEFRDSDVYEENPIAIGTSDMAPTVLFTVETARELWRELGHALSAADSAAARRKLEAKQTP